MANASWIWCSDQEIPSDTTAGRRILDQLLHHLQAQSWPDRDVFGVQLAVEEALVNAIKHGNGFAPEKKVQFHCLLADDMVRIVISDEGSGFDPNRLPDPTAPERLECPCGRGVMLMRAFMSRVEFNERGNQVCMEKHRDACERSAAPGAAISYPSGPQDACHPSPG